MYYRREIFVFKNLFTSSLRLPSGSFRCVFYIAVYAVDQIYLFFLFFTKYIQGIKSLLTSFILHHKLPRFATLWEGPEVGPPASMKGTLFIMPLKINMYSIFLTKSHRRQAV